MKSKDEAELGPWRKFKKVELHRHMEGAVRLSTVLAVAAEARVRLPATTEEDLREHALVLAPMKDLTTVLNKFMLVQSVLATPNIIKRVAYENCVDAYNESIRVLELRYSPGFIRINHPHLNFDSIHQAIMDGVGQAVKEFHGKLAVGLICIVTREQPLTEAEETTDFVIANRDAFVGFDLAGDEVAVRGAVFEKFFDRARAAGLGITIHSGEANVPGAAQFVRESVEVLGATRIGHGVQVIHDAQVMDFIREKNVVLEVCPTSNVLTNAFASLEQHPIRKLLEADLKVTLNSDDPHIFGIDLTHEYEILANRMMFTQAEFEEFNATALAATFIPKSAANQAWNF